jgi:hypothetical protein
VTRKDSPNFALTLVRPPEQPERLSPPEFGLPTPEGTGNQTGNKTGNWRIADVSETGTSRVLVGFPVPGGANGPVELMSPGPSLPAFGLARIPGDP